MCSSSQLTQSGNLQDNGTYFFIGMSLKDKNELSTTLYISCLKKDFRIKKVINSSSVFCFKCANPNCKWWLRAVKYASSDRFIINVYKNYHTCGLKHITIHNPHATTKILGQYFQNRFPNVKDPSISDMANQLLIELGVTVSYWKIYMAMGISKELFNTSYYP